jgi:hypothetical protein
VAAQLREGTRAGPHRRRIPRLGHPAQRQQITLEIKQHAETSASSGGCGSCCGVILGPAQVAPLGLKSPERKVHGRLSSETRSRPSWSNSVDRPGRYQSNSEAQSDRNSADRSEPRKSISIPDGNHRSHPNIRSTRKDPDGERHPRAPVNRGPQPSCRPAAPSCKSLQLRQVQEVHLT